MKVMLIDDSEIEIFVSSKLLTNAKIPSNISAFLEARRAFEFIQTHQNSPEHLPDLILLDIHMPLMNGFQFIEHLETIESPHVKNIVVIILSSTADPVDVKNSLKFVCVKEVFSKPLSVEQLVLAIENI